MKIKSHRIIFMAFGLISLLVGLWAGLSRVGWNLYVTPAVVHHGAIMVGGFLGTVITLEKIIPLKNKLLYLIPALSAGGVLCFFILNPLVSILMITISSIALSFVFAVYFKRTKTIVYFLMLIGGICWLIGNLLLLMKNFYPLAFPWWMCFTLFIISAERLELMKFLPVSRLMKYVFVSLLMLCLIGASISFHGVGSFVMGFGLIFMATWLLRFDLIGITIRKEGLTKFVAIALGCGYVSLLFTGIFFVTTFDKLLGYDVVVHAYFIGFVLSMIFAHGPIILPGVLGITAKPFHPMLYFWLFLLHSSWLFRITADLYMDLEWRKISGLLSAIAIVGYFATMAILTIRSHRYASIR